MPTRSARYAALAQEADIVPIVEPEVLMDGPHASHDIDECYRVTEWTLTTSSASSTTRVSISKGSS